MPYGDANAIVVDMAKEVLPIVNRTPVLAGVCGIDPFRIIPKFLQELKDMGFAGVQNFPTVGLIHGTFRANLEETGMGYKKEVEMVRKASRLNLLTAPYAFNDEDAKAMAHAGADILVCHLDLMVSGSIGAKTRKTLYDCISLIQSMTSEATEINPDILVLCHGGPIATQKDAQYVLTRTKGIHGFFGASDMERLPVETAITDITKESKDVTFEERDN